MAANDDSPKRRRLRLQKRGDENVTPDSRSLEGSPSGRRTSGPRTRLSAGKLDEVGSGGGCSVNRPQRRSRGQKAEDPGHNGKARGGTAAGEGGTSGGTPEDRAPAPPSEDRAPAPPAEGRAPVHPTEGRAPVHPTEDRAPVHPTEDRAPVHPTEDRAPVHPTEDRAPVHPTEDRAPVHPTEDRAPVHPTEDRAPVHPTEDRAPVHPTEDRAPVHPTEDRTQSSAAPGEKSHPIHGKTIKTRRSRDGLQGNGSPSRPELKKDGGSTPFMVNQKRNDVREAGSSRVSGGGEQETVGKIKDVTHEGRASSSTSKTKDGEKAGTSVERTRTDGKEVGASGAYRVASGENAGPSRQSASGDSENANASVQSPSKRPVCGTKSPVINADPGTSEAAPPRDSKVQCTSKQLLQEVLGMCAEFSKQILESQNYLNQEQRQLEHRNFTWNFETAFQDNVSINGQSWQEAPDTASEPDIKILEDQLDDAIVETAMKRKRHPRKILGHFVKMLKVEREILDHYKPVVEPKQLKLDSRSESRMTEQTATTASISQQIKETMKALPAQLEKAKGFSQVLSLQPVLQGSRIRQDIFSSRVVLQDMAKTVPKELETTPRDSEFAAKIAPPRNMRRRQSPSVQNSLYPLRSKRKISLEG